MLEGKNGGNLLGFHGRSGQALDAIGAYFSLLPQPEKIPAVGGDMGVAFDDGVFDGVKKITVGKDLGCVSYIKIEYEKNGNFLTREHGTIRGELKEFALDYPNECITSVGGSYGHVDIYKAVLIKTIFFQTSYGRISPTFGDATSPAGKEFMLEGKNGGQLLGFHGRSGQAIDALGAYFSPSPAPTPEKIDAVGGDMGVLFDDGVFDGVKKLTVGKDLNCVSYIKIEYEKDGKVETREHGTIRGEVKEFVVNYPSESIISVGGSYGDVDLYKAVLIKTLFFKTSYGRTSPTFGEPNSPGKEFLLEGKNGGKLVGFHGRSGQAIDSIGAYFWSVPAPQKIEAVGGKMGVAFDDGVFEGVRKIIVGKDLGCISYIKIEYEKERKVESREHGTIRGELNEFAVDYPTESITSLGGSYGLVNLYNDVLIKSLVFKTSTGRTSPIFGSPGNPVGEEFMFEGKNGGKLLGFHGRSGQAIDAIGVYFGTGSG
ncbi:hypothetical protein CARUB_v10000839mg [Capsella rubella]|uniref:Jacalin-type lectin domain-containing protein n=1 Tax=Capsella rubella TaxID=81985 RepID=R0H6R4_9BRAS|nr:hypothetical protein CARUB_v10000839mg [Capsella rubella]